MTSIDLIGAVLPLSCQKFPVPRCAAPPKLDDGAGTARAAGGSPRTKCERETS
jgi:hypothetical protein